MAKDTVLINPDGTFVVDADGDVVLADTANPTGCECCADEPEPPQNNCCPVVGNPGACVFVANPSNPNLPLRPTVSVSFSGTRQRTWTNTSGVGVGTYAWDYTISGSFSGQLNQFDSVGDCNGYSFIRNGIGSMVFNSSGAVVPTNPPFTDSLNINNFSAIARNASQTGNTTASCTVFRQNEPTTPVQSIINFIARCPPTAPTAGMRIYAPTFGGGWIVNQTATSVVNCGSCSASTSGSVTYSVTETLSTADGNGTGSGDFTFTWNWSPITECPVNAFA